MGVPRPGPGPLPSGEKAVRLGAGAGQVVWGRSEQSLCSELDLG